MRRFLCPAKFRDGSGGKVERWDGLVEMGWMGLRYLL